MKEKNKSKEIYCDYDYFMKHGCKGCKLGRLCEEWGRNRIKRDSNNNDTNFNIHNDKQKG
ncbi:MAG: hypothetical protein Q4E39_05180 [bacterium]|nr:hypothetical protein [bacterium]